MKIVLNRTMNAVAVGPAKLIDWNQKAAARAFAPPTITPSFQFFLNKVTVSALFLNSKTAAATKKAIPNHSTLRVSGFVYSRKCLATTKPVERNSDERT